MMASKTLTAIVASVVVGAGFLTVGSMLSKGHLERKEEKYKIKQADSVISLIADIDNSGDLDKRELQVVYICIRGEIKKFGSEELTLIEKEGYIKKSGYYWNPAHKKYEKAEEPKKEPCYKTTPKDSRKR
jgi:hypothetical protein